MEQPEINATIRNLIGKGAARTLRSQGEIPAVLYGPSTETVMLAVKSSELEKLSNRYNISQMLLNLVVEADKPLNKKVMIKELQTHPVTQKFVHVDFYEIAMDRKIWVNIPVTTTGMAKGVEEGGILQIVRRELEVLCLPGQIPDKVEIDIREMEIGDSVHIEDIQLPADVEVSADVNFTILTVVSPQREEVEAVEEAELAEEEIEGAEAEAESETPEAREEE